VATVLRLTLPPAVQSDLFDHVRRALPQEAVGLLGGTSSGRVDIVLPLPNIAGDERTFFADPFAQFTALNRLRRNAQELLAIYHSHPGGGTDASQVDLEYARAWSCAHVIIAVDAGSGAGARMRAFRLAESGMIESVPIDVSGP
jgi:[CysO sulfur-carrier protein]-S-L-cysteine hydrolase